MTYKRVQPYTKEEAEIAFAQGTSEQISDALLGITYYVEDWQWVQDHCLTLLDRSETQIQWVAIQCLGHLAAFHKTLDLAIVLPALQTHASDPKLASALSNALDDIAGIEDTSYFEQNWKELPQRIKDVQIASGMFDRGGKRVRKRNFISRQQGETRGEVSGEQELLESLKQQWNADSSHDWQEYYDEQGRLLRLSLADLGLVHPPVELWQFTSLQELDLSENRLSSLPAELGRLVNLESLNLGQNEFSRLPEGLEQLISLQELDLSQNQLSSLSAELGQLVQLRWLGLHQNRLSSLPAEIGQLVYLLWLVLRQNQLRSMPAELGQLANLYVLDLRQNQLKSVPAELGQLANLYELDLRQNQLRSLPAELGQLVNLQVLDLSQNPQLQVPSPEIVKEGIHAVLAYLRTLR